MIMESLGVSLKLEINSKKIDLKATNYVIGNNATLNSGWINKAKRIWLVQEYLYEFVSPFSCTNCLVKITGHSPSYLSRYSIELHSNVDRSYYFAGHIAALSTLVFVLAFFVAIPYIVIKAIKTALQYGLKR